MTWYTHPISCIPRLLFHNLTWIMAVSWWNTANSFLVHQLTLSFLLQLNCCTTVRIPATSYLIPLFTFIYQVLFHLLLPSHLDVPCYLTNRQRYCSALVWKDRTLYSNWCGLEVLLPLLKWVYHPNCQTLNEWHRHMLHSQEPLLVWSPAYWTLLFTCLTLSFSFSPQPIAIRLILFPYKLLLSIIHCSNPLILTFQPSLLSILPIWCFSHVCITNTFLLLSSPEPCAEGAAFPAISLSLHVLTKVNEESISWIKVFTSLIRPCPAEHQLPNH